MYLCSVLRKGNYFRLVGMLLSIMLWMFSMGVATVHHHLPEDSRESVHFAQEKQHDHQQQNDPCHHSHDHSSDQDCGICFLIHHNNPVVLSYFAASFALVYPATLPPLATPYLWSFPQDHDLGAPSLRGPPLA